MGVLNVTPDSFSDGGQFNQTDKALQKIETMLENGADIIDIGGESTRPNAEPVPVEEELKRVIPVIEQAVKRFEPYISIDTFKLDVMRAAVEAGASMINDVNALRNEGCVEYVATTDADICLMHMQGKPADMQNSPKYDGVLKDVNEFLTQRVDVCRKAGIDKSRIVIDPGFGFGKTFQNNIDLFKGLSSIIQGDYPVLVGVSRKTMLGDILDGAPVEERQLASVIAGIKAAFNYNAQIIRVHDVKETTEAIKVWKAL